MASNDATQTETEFTPAGYRMPAEWEPQEAVWIAWPHNRSDWPGKIAPIPWVYGEIVRHLQVYQRVNILVNDASAETQVRRILRRLPIDLKQISFYRFPTQRVWTRDYGPTFLVGPNGEKALLDWRFNAWAKYPDWKKDDTIPSKIGKALKLPVHRPTWNERRVVLEGGSIDVNGAGLLLTSEECLLSEVQARNPEMSREDLEHVFRENLGVRKVLWLNRGIVGDDTHGHIDDIARFVGPRRVIATVERNSSDENYALLQENWDRLQGMADIGGEKLEIIALPMPTPLWFRGQRLPASYANFYIANGIVLVPTFNDPNDRHALGILAEVFPDRKVVGIHAVDLVWGLGTLHCLTQQEPRN